MSGTGTTLAFPAEREKVRVMTIHSAVDLYLDSIQGRRPRTRDSYRRLLGKLGDMYPYIDVDEVTEVMLLRYLAQWPNAANATKAQLVSILNSFFGWLEDRQITPTNPAEQLERPKLPKPEEQDDIVSLTTDDVSRMLKAAEGWTEVLALHMLAYTGARRHAVAQLRLRDYDPAEGKLKFREKGNKTIRKPIPAHLSRLLDAAITAGVYDSLDDYLIPPLAKVRRKKGRDDKIIWKTVKRVAVRAGVKDAHAHAFRAAFAVHFLETKPDKLVALQSLLGHSNLETTRVYLRRLDRNRQMEEVRDLSWGQDPEMIFEVLPLTEKEGFEPSFDGSGATMRQGTQSDGGVVVDLMERLRQRQQEKA